MPEDGIALLMQLFFNRSLFMEHLLPHNILLRIYRIVVLGNYLFRAQRKNVFSKALKVGAIILRATIC